MGERSSGFFFAGVVLIAACSTGAIVATYSRLSHTWDEGTHVAAGLELLQDHQYTLQTENPPLARVALALVPYASGARLPSTRPRRVTIGSGAAAEIVFHRNADYVRNVTEARVANLLFFWSCVALTWILAGGRSDPWVAFLAAAAVATLPPIVAHAGVATTDVAFVAAFLLAVLGLRRFFKHPGVVSAALAGATVGAAVATKFSTFVFLPPAVAAIVALQWWKRRSLRIGSSPWVVLAVAGAAAAGIVWASYGFDVGRLSDLPRRFGSYGVMPTDGWPAFVRDWKLPGHEFLHGVLFLRAHAAAGHEVTLFDRFSRHGFVLFYPVVLATKTPVPFLLFVGLGIGGLLRYRADPRWTWCAGLGLAALAVLLAALHSPLNLGVRHVLVIYPLVAIAAAFGLARWAEHSANRRFVLAVGAGCVALQLALLIWSVPDQIAYFNVFAGREPGYVSGDSDFDWGQDALALERYFAEHPVPELYVLLTGTPKTCSLKLPPLKALPNHPVNGWIAISERQYRMNQGVVRENPCDYPDAPGKVFLAPPGWLDWLKRHRPVAIIGQTVRLYHIEGAE